MFDSFFNPKIPFVALDLSDRSLKIARAKQERGRTSLVGALRTDIPENVVYQGRVLQSDVLARTIREALRTPQAKKLRAPGVAMTLPEEHCFVRVIRVPRLPEEELEQAIRWEAESAIPIAASEAVISWEGIAENAEEDHFDVLVAGVSKDLVQTYVDTLRLVPLIPVAFEPESFAIARALLNTADQNTTLIIDLGREHTGVIIARGGHVLVTANVPLAARVFTERVAAARKLSMEQAETMKREIGILPKGEGILLREALCPVLDEIVKQIQQFFTYSETHTHADFSKGAVIEGTKVHHVLLAGGEALMPGLPEYFAQALGVPVTVGDPILNLWKADKKSIGHPLYTSVIGLALYGS